MGNNTPLVSYVLGAVKNWIVLNILISFLSAIYGELCFF